MEDPLSRIWNKRRGEILAASFVVILSALLFGFAPNKIIQHGYGIGSKAEDFRLMNVDDQELGLMDYMAGQEGVVVVFTCNHCPFSKRYEDRLIALHQKLKPLGFPVLAINPNDASKQPEDSFGAMKKRAEEKDYPFPYLHDNKQQVAKAFGASRTPHVFVLSKENGQAIVRYEGGIDDNPNNASQAKEHYVENAVKALLGGQKPKPESTKAIGCTIKWG